MKNNFPQVERDAIRRDRLGCRVRNVKVIRVPPTWTSSYNRRCIHARGAVSATIDDRLSTDRLESRKDTGRRQALVAEELSVWALLARTVLAFLCKELQGRGEGDAFTHQDEEKKRQALGVEFGDSHRCLFFVFQMKEFSGN